MRNSVKLFDNQSLIPNSARANLIGMWDGGKQLPVYYSLTSLGTNMSFESSATDWTGAGTGSYTISTEQAKSGTKSAKLVTSAQSALYRREIAADNGDKIFVGIWVYVTAGSTGTVLELYDGGGYSNVVSASPNYALTNQWQFIGALKTATASGIRLVVGSIADITRTIYVDDVETINLTDSIALGCEPTAAEMLDILTKDGTTFWEGARTVHCNPGSKYFWHDYSGNGHHAKLTNFAYTPGSTLSAQNGLELDATDDRGDIADSQATRMITGGSIFAVIFPKTIGETGGRIVDKSTTTSGANGYVLFTYQVNQVGLTINGGTITTTTLNAITLNKKQVVIADFSSLGRHIFVNNKDVTASGGDETGLPPDVAGTVALGNRADNTDRSYDGYEELIITFDRPLTYNERAHMQRYCERKYNI